MVEAEKLQLRQEISTDALVKEKPYLLTGLHDVGLIQLREKTGKPAREWMTAGLQLKGKYNAINEY